MTHACRYVIEFELHGGRSRNLATRLRLPWTGASTAIGANQTALIEFRTRAIVLQFFRVLKIAKSIPEVQADRSRLQIPPNLKLSQATRNCIVHPLSIRRLAATQHWRASVTDSTTYSLQMVRISYCRKYSWDRSSGSSIWKNPEKWKSDPPGNIPHPRNKFTRIASPDTINVTTPDATSSHHCPTRRRPSSGNRIASVSFVRTKTRTRTGIMERVHSDHKQISQTRAYGARKSDQRARFQPVAWRGLQTLEFQKKGSNGLP